MSRWAGFLARRGHRGKLIAEAQERALEREAARMREAFALAEGPAGGKMARRGIVVRWGLAGDGKEIARLLDLNGMPRWVAFEERFVVAAKPEGRVLAALRYRTEPERLVLGLLVADPWGGERRLAVALYAGAGELAREMGVGEVLAGTGRRAAYLGKVGYLREAGYARRADGWRLDPTRPEPRVAPAAGAKEGLPAGGWRRWLALWGAGSVPFFGAFRE